MFREMNGAGIERIQPPEIHKASETLASIPEFVAPTSTWSSFWERFKKAASLFPDAPIPRHIKEKHDRDIASREKLATYKGIDFSRCQIGKVIEAYRQGVRIDIDTVTPYAHNYDMKNGIMWLKKLTNEDAFGLAIGRRLRMLFSGKTARMVCLWDAYNTRLRDSTDARGTPIQNAPQIVLPDEIQKKFGQSVEDVMRHEGLIRDGDVEGKDYLLISESSKVRDAEELVKMLEAKGYIHREGSAIHFINLDAENPKYRDLVLRTTNGKWMCAALDASAFLKKENLEIMHLVILPNDDKDEDDFKGQQDQVWEILRILGIKPENYQNIFVPRDANPETVATAIEELFVMKMKEMQSSRS